jgi:choline dehydrogenase-like flavoprotein
VSAQERQRRFAERSEVDFVVVGSGAAGGVLAKELATAGFDVVVLEQGPWRHEGHFTHDELDDGLGGRDPGDPQCFRRTVGDEPERRGAAFYLPVVGGTTVHFTGNYWRFREIDFIERSLLGPFRGTGIADWPITYHDLEPYYTKVDWEIGVSGAPGPHDPPRSRPYPMPPLPVKSSGVLLERAARRLGWHAFPAPMAILSQPHNGRPPCQHCGWCMGFGCEFRAKSSSLVTMIPLAQATGHCEIRAESTVWRIETNRRGRVSEVVYFDREGRRHAQRARAVVLCANGAETPRILLMSASSRFPDGLANSSGMVGRYLMDNGQVHAYGVFEHPLNEHKSVQVTRVIWDFYETDLRRGYYGGGGIDARFQFTPIGFGLDALPPDAPRWGAEYKRMLGRYFNHTIDVNGHTTKIPLETNTITLDPEAKDRFGRPGLCVTYRDHPDDLAVQAFFLERCREVVQAMEPTRLWDRPVRETRGLAHLLGTCRMGDDPRESVVNRYHRAHDVPNLFICDGSSFVSSGRGQPTMTIQALAFRAAEPIARFAGAGAP